MRGFPPLPLAPKPFEEGTARIDGRRVLGFAQYGDPTGLPVLWFHGTPGGRRQVPPLAASEAMARGMRIIGVERPGTGRSTDHRYREVFEFARDIEALADDLALDRFGVVGLSGGGPYTLACARALPHRVVAAAVLGGIGPVSGKEAVPSYTRLLALLHPLLRKVAPPIGRLSPFLSRLIPHADLAIESFAKIAPRADRPVLRDPAFRDALISDMANAIEENLRAHAYDAVLLSRDWGFSLEDIRVPVQFFQGDADGIVPPKHGRFQASRVPGSTLHRRPGQGHFAGFVNVADVLDVLRPHF